MSIITKTGDQGSTGLMYNRRVAKCHPRVEAYGAVDELNAALGLARASAGREGWNEIPTRRDLVPLLLEVQKDLIILMGELATAVEDLPRYQQDGYSLVSAAMTARLEEQARQLESQTKGLQGWALPGATLQGAALDVARTTCRRAERRVCALQEAGQLHNPEMITYLNRLSDLLWLLARQVEQPPS